MKVVQYSALRRICNTNTWFRILSVPRLPRFCSSFTSTLSRKRREFKNPLLACNQETNLTLGESPLQEYLKDLSLKHRQNCNAVQLSQFIERPLSSLSECCLDLPRIGNSVGHRVTDILCWYSFCRLYLFNPFLWSMLVKSKTPWVTPFDGSDCKMSQRDRLKFPFVLHSQ